MEQARWGRWIHASHGLARVSHFAPVIVQGLGRLDCQLIESDERFVKSTPESWDAAEQLLGFNDHLTQSYLWVLGAYEIIRTVDQRAHEDLSMYGPELTNFIRGQKHRFERLRVPMAKLEASRKHPTDWSVAYPALSRDHGAAWQVGDDVFISRRELSEELLMILEGLRLHRDANA